LEGEEEGHFDAFTRDGVLLTRRAPARLLLLLLFMVFKDSLGGIGLSIRVLEDVDGADELIRHGVERGKSRSVHP